MHARALIVGLAGPRLGADERAFLREAEPWGLILFTRNISTPDQVRALVADFRETLGRADAPVLVDQEGGRVQRFGPPHWPEYPAGAAYGRLYDRKPELGVAAARMGARLIAADLEGNGFCRISPPCPASARNERPCCVHRDRSSRARDNFGDNGARGDSWVDRIRRTADDG